MVQCAQAYPKSDESVYNERFCGENLPLAPLSETVPHVAELVFRVCWLLLGRKLEWLNSFLVWHPRVQQEQSNKPRLCRNSGCQRERDSQGHWFEPTALTLCNSIHKAQAPRGPINTEWPVSCSLIAQSSAEEGCSLLPFGCCMTLHHTVFLMVHKPQKRLYWNVTYFGLHWSSNSAFRICGPDNWQTAFMWLKQLLIQELKLKARFPTGINQSRFISLQSFDSSWAFMICQGVSARLMVSGFKLARNWEALPSLEERSQPCAD